MMLNIIAHDNWLNTDNCYTAVEVYKGMPKIITTY